MFSLQPCASESACSADCVGGGQPCRARGNLGKGPPRHGVKGGRRLCPSKGPGGRRLSPGKGGGRTGRSRESSWDGERGTILGPGKWWQAKRARVLEEGAHQAKRTGFQFETGDFLK